MHLFGHVDDGTQYFFDHFTKVRSHLLPVFSTSCFLTSPWVATAVTLLAAFLLVRQGYLRTGLIVLAGFVAGSFLVEGVRLLIQRPLSSFATTWVDSPGFFPGHLRNTFSTFPSESLLLSTFAWMSLLHASRKLGWNRVATYALMLLGMIVVFGGFLSNLCLSQHYLTDLLAGLAGGAGLALLAWSFDRHAIAQTADSLRTE